MAITSEMVRAIFAKLSSEAPEAFFQYVADDVHWTVLGTHPLADLYTSKHEFQEATFARLGKLFDSRLKLFTRQVLVDEDRAAVELFIRATTKRGVQFNNDYCWICQFQGEQIVEVRAYLDSALVAKAIEHG